MTGTERKRRYRCEGCGNLTRFDVHETVTSVTYKHFDLGGDLISEERDVKYHDVMEVTCRWCERGPVVEEDAPRQ